MIPRKMKIATMAILASAGIVVGLAGPASASHGPITLGPVGTVGTPSSTGGYQMFGVVTCYGNQPVRGISVDGLLTGGIGIPSGPVSQSVHTDAAGIYRLTGTINWAARISTGGNVAVNVPPSGVATTNIGLAEFEAKRVGGLTGTSAGPFNFDLPKAFCDTLPTDPA